MQGGCEHLSLQANCPHCMNLQTHYYNKLKESGWIDIEDTSHPLRPLKCWHSLKWIRLTQTRIDRIETYYKKARELLHTYPFTSDLQKKIWELHCEGVTERKIVEILK